MITYLDNRGGGDCGYLAFAIGLIEQIQRQCRENDGNSALLARWQHLDNSLPKNILDRLLNFDMQKMDQDPNYNSALLNTLQLSLRKICYDKIVHERNDILFDDFMALINDDRTSSLYNRLAASTEVKEFAQRLSGQSRDVIRAAFEENLNSGEDSSVIKATKEYITKPGNWATDQELGVLAGAFSVDLRITNTDISSPEISSRPGDPKIHLHNQGNYHWVTVTNLEQPLPSPVAAETRSIRPSNPEDEEKFKNYKQLIQATFLSTDWMQTSAHPAEVTRFEDETDDKFRDRQKQIHDDETLARKLQVEEVRDVSPEDVEQALSSFKPSR